MKLYATVKSERATKGQGGKWLNIVIRNEDNKPVIAIKARTGGAHGVHAFISSDMRYANTRIENVGFIEDDKHNPSTCKNSAPCFDCEQIERGKKQKDKNVQSARQMFEDKHDGAGDMQE